ncbi:MAG: methylmalonyl Co-A mutase-associated GTPase MeaB [Actinobacteria bacterium]|jgi:LAO/AO transport system kinase|nr:methylmalonyl Co-A mutase-associated GTPase MeaB [Actinomycetota bacterium]MSO17170.1 methylmalonyl Co-A mutase-associated GTPase MeaB [Acidimicrobiia bacterium]
MSQLAHDLLAHDRRALARAITLVESTRPDHRNESDELLAEIIAHTGGSIRVGISGAPGAGKSTLIETLGLNLVAAGHRVAVLAVDPSSTLSGGSILGDKTRMDELVRQEEAFIRPSPTGGTLGGVARRTREAMLCCEAAGFDVVIVETVGVGQSEVAVESMVDCFALIIAPGGGDELQGIKRGIVELADLVIVNKADGDMAAVAKSTSADYANALHLLRPKTNAWNARTVLCSALEKRGIDDVWTAIADHQETIRASGDLDIRRSEQSRSWLWSEISESLIDRLRADAQVAAVIAEVEAAVVAGTLPASVAATRVLDQFSN